MMNIDNKLPEKLLNNDKEIDNQNPDNLLKENFENCHYETMIARKEPEVVYAYIPLSKNMVSSNSEASSEQELLSEKFNEAPTSHAQQSNSLHQKELTNELSEYDSLNIYNDEI